MAASRKRDPLGDLADKIGKAQNESKDQDSLKIDKRTTTAKTVSKSLPKSDTTESNMLSNIKPKKDIEDKLLTKTYYFRKSTIQNFNKAMKEYNYKKKSEFMDMIVNSACLELLSKAAEDKRTR